MAEKPLYDAYLPDADRRTFSDVVKTKIWIPSHELCQCKVVVASNPGGNRQRVVGDSNVVSESDHGDRAREGRTKSGVCQCGAEKVAVEVIETCGRDLVDDGGLGAGEVGGGGNGDVLWTFRGCDFGFVQLCAAEEIVSFRELAPRGQGTKGNMLRNDVGIIVGRRYGIAQLAVELHVLPDLRCDVAIQLR